MKVLKQQTSYDYEHNLKKVYSVIDCGDKLVGRTELIDRSGCTISVVDQQLPYSDGSYISRPVEPKEEFPSNHLLLLEEI